MKNGRESPPNTESADKEPLENRTTQSIYSTSTDSKNLVLTVLVEGIPILAVVDTAAQVSVINAKLAKKWALNKKGEPTILKGIGNQPIRAEVVTDVKLIMGDQMYTTTLVAAEIEEDMLLGIDFLSEHKAVIDLSRQEVRIGDQVIVAGLIKENQEWSAGCRVTLVGRTRVPAFSTTFSVGQLSQRTKKDFVFTPTRDAVPWDAVPGKFTTIQFVNDTDCTVFMEAGTLVGTVIAGDQMSIPEKKGERKVKKVRRNEASSQVLPEHLVDLYKRSSEGLTEAEKEELKALLIEYADVFSAHDLDLGCFSATPHRINFEKEETSPIRQRMRRVPKGFEEEEEKHLKQMLEAGVIQPSVSPWASPPVLGKKTGGGGGGGVRWCLDFRKLNAVTKKRRISVTSHFG